MYSETVSYPRIEQKQRTQPEQLLKPSYWQRQMTVLLSLSTRDLYDRILAEAERNPALEIDYTPSGGGLTEDIAAPGQSLKEWLRIQLAAAGYPQLRQTALYLIESLDESGYLPPDIVETAILLGAQRLHARRALALVQTLDPPGVGARSVRECLLLQLLRSGNKNGDAWQLLKFGFDEMNAGNREALLQSWGWDEQRLNEAIGVLRQFDPYPAANFGDAAVAAAVPDVQIVMADNRLSARLFEHALPRVAVSPGYLEAMGADAAGRSFASSGIFYARRFLYCLQKRNETLLKVAQRAVDAQGQYLLGGVKKPLTMKSIAGELGLHPSTITHAVSNKYVQYGAKVFALGELFERECAQGMSKEQVMRAIAQIASREENLSDQKLAARLKERYAAEIPRRTVAKYRKLLGFGGRESAT